MKEWFIRTFLKRKAVRLYVETHDGRLLEFWVIPKGNQVTIKGVGTFVITKEEVLLSSKNVPTYLYNIDRPEPFNLGTKEISAMTPEEFNIALESNIAHQIFLATKTGMLSQDTIYILVGLAIGFAGLGYYLSSKLDFIIEQLNSLGIS